jgi:two-component system sensor histidine kinase QseC
VFDATEGFADLRLGEPPSLWRSFSHWDSNHERKVMVLLSVQERDDLAKDIAGQLIEPGLWLLPVVFLALGLAIWRGLRPLYALSDDVARLDVGQGQRLPAHHAMREFNSVVHSINDLVEQQNAALLRERRLANEVAHELRTPLASIVLQARALGGTLTDADRLQAQARIGEDALRASRVLDQLLMLARTSRAELHEAWERQDDIAVAGLDTLPLQGHPLLLEQALRNLLENALKHTPAGTQIEVRLGLDATADGDVPWLRVSDDGARAGTAEPGLPELRARATDSLRLGHEIITRVADLHGARFGAEPAQPPFTTCFALRFRAMAAMTADKPPSA